MTRMQYRFSVDTNYDGTFSSTYDDITAYLIRSLSWSNGMADSYDEVAPPARLSCTLTNVNGEFNREPISGELVVNSVFDSWSGGYPVGWTTTDNPGASSIIAQVGSGVLAPGSGTGSCGVSDPTSEVTLSQSILTVGHAYRMDVVVSASENSVGVKATTYSAAGKITNGSKLIGYLAAVNVPTRFTNQFHEVTFGVPASNSFSFVFIATSPTFTIQAGGAGWKQTFDSVSVVEMPLYSIVKRDMLVRLQAIYQGTTYTRYIGRISDMQFGVGNNLEPTVAITAEDPMLTLLDAEYQPSLLLDATIDEPITEMLDTGVVRWPYSRNFWLMGTAGSSELGLSTYLYQNTISTFDTGITELSYVGDVADRGEGVSAQGYIRDLVAAEAGGRFYFDTRQQKFIFKNRNTDPLNYTSSDSFVQTDFDTVQFLYGNEVVNQLTINFSARTVGAALSTIWSDITVPYIVNNGKTKVITARYFNSSNAQQKIGATDRIAVVPTTDYTANTSSTGSGEDMTNLITVTADMGATGAKIYIDNSSGKDVYITFLRLRGTPLTQSDDSVESVSGDSIRSNELHPKTIDVRMLDDKEFAQNYADYQVSRFKDPIPRLRAVTFGTGISDRMLLASLTRAINDLITITIGSISHVSKYYVVGEQYTVVIGGDNPTNCTWILKPGLREIYWLLGVTDRSELDNTTYLGF